MSDEEKVPVEEETTEGQEKQGADWTEEFKVAGEELLETVKRLVHEAGVRRVVLKNRHGRVLIELPLVLGLAGITLMPYYAAIAVMAALATECTLLVERTEAKPKAS